MRTALVASSPLRLLSCRLLRRDFSVLSRLTRSQPTTFSPLFLSPQLHRGAALRLVHSADSRAAPETAIKRIQAAFVDAGSSCAERFEASLGEDGILLLDLGDKGQYSLQAQGERLLLFSPISGPKYYSYDAGNGWWSAPDDGHLLEELLVRELMHTTSVYLNL